MYIGLMTFFTFLCLDKLNLFELYNSVKAVNEAAPHLQLGSTVEKLEERYAKALEANETYYRELS